MSTTANTTSKIEVSELYRMVAGRLEDLGHVAEVAEGETGYYGARRSLHVDGVKVDFHAFRGGKHRYWFVTAYGRIARGRKDTKAVVDKAANRIHEKMPSLHRREAEAKEAATRAKAVEAKKKEAAAVGLEVSSYGSVPTLRAWKFAELDIDTEPEKMTSGLLADLAALKAGFLAELAKLRETHGV